MPDEVPGWEQAFGRQRFWFFFDTEGSLLAWSDTWTGTWLLEDVTGDGIKDLLVSGARGPGPQPAVDFDVPATALVWYTVFVNCRPNGTGITFGHGPEPQVSYGFALIHLQDCSIPLVMTLEGDNPCKDAWDGTRGKRAGGGLFENESCAQNEESEVCYTVIRSFMGGRPRLILVVPHRLQMITEPGGDVVLKPERIQGDLGEKYQVRYSPLKRKFEVEWPAGDVDKIDPILFSARVPE